jgi:methionyl-tRNA synthetase
MRANGDIVSGTYQGFYCISCEAYIKEGDLADGLCPHHKQPPQRLQEENLFFRLSRYTQRLLEHFREDPSFVLPSSRYNELLEILDRGLEDISISRKGKGWGIPIPWDPSQRVYVWVDALINYVTGAGFMADPARFSRVWPCDLHIVGKDITRFHGIIWPAILLSAGLALPKRVFGHGFVRMAGQKLCKTLGGTLDIQDLLKAYPSDALRYFLMREIPFERDGDFSEERLLERYNADLANDLGNLLQRVSTLLERQEGGAIPAGIEPEGALFGDFLLLKNRVEEGYRSLMFHQALAEALGWVSRLNGYMAEQAPWTIYRSSDTSKARRTLANVVGGLKAAFVWLLPVMPTKAAEGLKQIGVDPGGTPDSLWGLAGETNWLFSSGRLGQTRTLFPRILEA